MTIDRENRVKALQNIGQYLIDHADEIIPVEKTRYPIKQTFTIEMSVETEIPTVSVETEYKMIESLRDVKWSAR